MKEIFNEIIFVGLKDFSTFALALKSTEVILERSVEIVDSTLVPVPNLI